MAAQCVAEGEKGNAYGLAQGESQECVCRREYGYETKDEKDAQRMEARRKDVSEVLHDGNGLNG